MKLFKNLYVNVNEVGFKLGKRPSKQDSRNIKFTSILKKAELPPIPDKYIFDDTYSQYQIPTPMFANDQYGNCVIAGRAHQTLRFELFEQQKLLPITDKIVCDEYWKESGGTGPQYDNGLIVLDSLNKWRKNGWKIKCNRYKIYAFTQINPKIKSEVKTAIFLFSGIGVGLMLPVSAKTQFFNNERWSVVNNNTGDFGSWGGHYVYIHGYTTEGPVCVTWGQYQHMTWEFFEKYCDEAYAIIDDKNKFTFDSPVDVEKLQEYLNQLT